MHKHKENGFAHFLIMIVVVALVVGLAFIFVSSKIDKKQNGQSGDKSFKNPITKAENLRFDIHPNTNEPPKLHLYWGSQKEALFDTDSLIEIEKFGVFEDIPVPNCDSKKDPGAEWAIHFKPGSLPIYTYAPGTITNIQDETTSKELVVRYGSQYAVKYLHVTNVPASLSQGQKVEAGTLIGYTQLYGSSNGYEFWEIEINKIIDGKIARTDFPLNYFDNESKSAFEKLRQSSKLTSWFVDENSKTAGWLAYTHKPEAWADISKLGIRSSGDDYCQFLRDNGLM